MAAESARSASSAVSYVGSLISLTSKSEIRYEGVLYSINTEESSIGLQNVRSFGTEGRQRDGPQVPPSDKIFEYILFRGSDIKDLQVKSSPPVQTTQHINSDPAIIQSHYPRPASTPSSLPPTVSRSLTDLSSHAAPLGHPRPGSTFQGGVPLYQPGGNLGSWGPSPPPPPSANGSGLAMPIYWQGYYGPPNGLPQLHQQSLPRPPPGLSIPPIQQPMQYSGFNASLPAGASNLLGSNLPGYPSPLIPTTSGSLSLTSTSLLPSSLPPILPQTPSVTLCNETSSTGMPSMSLNSALTMVTPSAGLSSLSPLTTSISDINAVIPSNSDKPNAISAPTLTYQTASQAIFSVVGTTGPSHSETPTPSLITPGQLLQSGPAAISSTQALETVNKDVEVVQESSSSEPLAPASVETQPPILPLPRASYTGQKFNGAPLQTRYGYRGHERGRGTGNSRPTSKFTEDFDFTAMNEKFKKDEVWGHLGKSSKSPYSNDKNVDGKGSNEEDSKNKDDVDKSKFEIKPVYSKDDFFDSISCNALGHESNNGRTRFSEQIKIDTETFGEFSRYRGGRGGRGFSRGGRSRGSYYGRGYGYGGRGRGRGQSVSSYAS